MAYGTIRADIIQGTNVTIDLSVAGQYEFAGDLFPDADSTRDLGSNTLRWQNLYVDVIDGFTSSGDILTSAANTGNIGTNAVRWGSIYSNEITAVNVYTGDLHLKNDKGDWTMIEAEDYLTLRNNKTGKIFRLLMEEVEG